MHDQLAALRTPHVAEVLDLVRRDGVSAVGTRRPFRGDTGLTGVVVSPPVLAVALMHDLNPVALQHDVDRYASAQLDATARAADAVRDPFANDPDRTTRRESVTNGDDWPIGFNG